MKACTKCGKKKALGEFYKDRSRKDRLQSCCKECNTTKCATWGKKHPEKLAKTARFWYEKNRFHAILQVSYNNAKKRSHAPCSATPEELEAAFTGKCHYCSKAGEDNGRYLSIDHDHETGEFRGWLCHICNTKDVLAKEKVNV